jgi:hypothetical protein
MEETALVVLDDYQRRNVRFTGRCRGPDIDWIRAIACMCRQREFMTAFDSRGGLFVRCLHKTAISRVENEKKTQVHEAMVTWPVAREMIQFRPVLVGGWNNQLRMHPRCIDRYCFSGCPRPV